MTKPILMEDLYIACENLNFDWHRNDVTEFIRLWQEDYTFDQIRAFVKRSEVECFLLYIDLVNRHKIKARKRGIYH